MLIIAERAGRAIREPSTDAMLSHTGSQIGHGWAFGLNELLDPTGATIGPLLTALVLYFHGGYHYAFALLLIPALLCLAAVTVARIAYPRPHELESREPVKLEAKGFSKTYWLYVVAGALVAAGFADFSLVAFHFQKTKTVAESAIPIFLFGGDGDKRDCGADFRKAAGQNRPAGGSVGIFPRRAVRAVRFSRRIRLCARGDDFVGRRHGRAGRAAQGDARESHSRDRRGTGYGVFDTLFGVAWFAGSAAMGLLYDQSVLAVVIFSVVLQLAALPAFVLASRAAK